MKPGLRNLLLLFMVLALVAVAIFLARQKPAWRARATRVFSRLDAHGFFERGKASLARGDASNAEADFAEAIRRGANTPEVFIQRALALEKLNDEPAALRNLDLAIAKDPDDQEAHKLRGDLHYKRNELTQAMLDYARLHGNPPNLAARSPESVLENDRAAQEQRLLANGDELAGRTDQALARYSAILRMDISNPMASFALQNRGNLYHKRGEIDKALRDYEEAIRMNSRNAGPYVDRALELEHQGDHEAALKDYDAALQLDPGLYQAAYDRALAYAAIGDRKKEEQDLDKAIELKSDFALAHVARGWLYAYQKKYTDAGEEFKTARTNDPTLAQPWIGLGRLNFQAGHGKLALDDFAEALKRNPDLPEVLNEIAWARATSPDRTVRDGKKAIEAALRACDQTKWADWVDIDSLAAAYAENHEFAKAVNFEQFALNLPKANSDPNEYSRSAKRLELYRHNQPYREAGRPNE